MRPGTRNEMLYIGMIVLAGLFLNIWQFGYPMSSDSITYAETAKDYRQDGLAGASAVKAPLFSLFLVPFQLILNPFYASKVASLLVFAILSAVIYLLARIWLNPEWSLAATFFVILNPFFFYFMGGSVHQFSDAFALLLLLGGLLLYFARKDLLWLSGIMIGCSVSTRLIMVFFVVPLLARESFSFIGGLRKPEWNRLAFVSLVSLAFISAFMLQMNAGKDIDTVTQGQNAFFGRYLLDNLFVVYPGVFLLMLFIFLPFFAFLIFRLVNSRVERRLTLLLVCSLSYIFLVSLFTGRLTQELLYVWTAGPMRYALAILPIITISAAFSFSRMRKGMAWLLGAFAALSMVLLLFYCNGALQAAFESVLPMTTSSLRQNERAEGISWVNENIPAGSSVIFNFRDPSADPLTDLNTLNDYVHYQVRDDMTVLKGFSKDQEKIRLEPGMFLVTEASNEMLAAQENLEGLSGVRLEEMHSSGGARPVKVYRVEVA